MKGKFWCLLLLSFYLESIYLPTLRKVIRAWQMNYMYTRLWFTQICVYRFYIPLLIRLANDVEVNPGPSFLTLWIVTKQFQLTSINVMFWCLEEIPVNSV